MTPPQCITLDQWLNSINIVIAIIGLVLIVYIANRLSPKNKYDHEIYISKKLDLSGLNMSDHMTPKIMLP